MTLPRRSVVAVLLLAGFGLHGCETQGPFEEAGEEIDEAVDEVEDARDSALAPPSERSGPQQPRRPPWALRLVDTAGPLYESGGA